MANEDILKWESVLLGQAGDSFFAYHKAFDTDLFAVDKILESLNRRYSTMGFSVFTGNFSEAQPVTVEEIVRSIQETGAPPDSPPLEKEIWAVQYISCEKLRQLSSHLGFLKEVDPVDCAEEQLLQIITIVDNVGAWTLSAVSSGYLDVQFKGINNDVAFLELLDMSYSFNKRFFRAEEKRNTWVRRMHNLRGFSLGYI